MTVGAAPRGENSRSVAAFAFGDGGATRPADATPPLVMATMGAVGIGGVVDVDDVDDGVLVAVPSGLSLRTRTFCGLLLALEDIVFFFFIFQR